jgi:hypothetical protein
MFIDGDGLARAAKQLDVALSEVAAAQHVDVPWLIRKGAAREAVDSALGAAHEWASGAAGDLAASGVAAQDARAAIEQLATDIDSMRSGGTAMSARGGEAFRSTVEGARQWRPGLDALGDGARSLEAGSARDWFVRSLAPDAPRHDVLAARALARDSRVDSLGDTVAGFLRRVQAEDPRSAELARVALEQGGSTASAALLDDLVAAASRGEQVDVGVLRSALRGLDDGAGDGARRLPTWLDGSATGTRALDAIDLQELTLLRELPDPAALGAEASAALARPAAQLERATIDRIAAMSQLPEHARPAVQDSTIDGVTLADALRRGDSAEPHLHRMWANGASKEDVAAVLDAPASVDAAHRLAAVADVRPDDLFGRAGGAEWRAGMRTQLAGTADDVTAGVLADTLGLHRSRPAPGAFDEETRTLLGSQLDAPKLRRLAALAQLPDGARPALLDDSAATAMEAAVSGAPTAAIDDLRWPLEREAILADPNARLRSMDEVGRVLAKGEDSITIDDLRRIRRFGTLPTGIAPDLSHSNQYTLDRAIESNWLPSTDSDARHIVSNLRRSIGLQRIDADPSITKETLTAELEAIATKSDDQVTQADLERLAFLDELPGTKRPDLPAAATGYSRRRIADSAWLPAADSDARAEFNSLRLWRDTNRAVRDPRITRESVAAELDELLARPNDAIGSDQMRRIALIDSLPADRRPILPALSESPRAMYVRGALPGSDETATSQLERLRRWNQGRHIAEDPQVTAETLFDELGGMLRKDDSAVTTDDLRRLAVFDEITGEKSLRLPGAATQYSRSRIADSNWLPSSDSDARAEFAMLRNWYERESIVRDPSATRASLTTELDAMLRKSDEQITHEDLRRLAALDELPAEKRPELPSAATQYSRRRIADSSWLPSSDSDSKAEFASLRDWSIIRQAAEDPAVTRATLTADLDAILAKSDDQVTLDDLRTIARLDMAPEAKRPYLPNAATTYTRRKIADAGWLPSSDSDSKAEFANLRLWREGQRLMEDPAVTRESIMQDLRTMLEKPNEDVTIDDLRRLAAIDAAPGEKRPPLPGAATQYSRSKLYTANWLPASDSDAKAEFTSLRKWLVRQDLLDDPANTREALTDQVARIAMKSDEQITPADLERIALIDELPIDRRPALPNAATQYSRRRIADSNWLPTSDSDSKAEFASLRRWAWTQSDEGRAEAARRLAAGETLEGPMIAGLAAAGEEKLAAAGISMADLLEATVPAMREPADVTALADIRANLMTAKSLTSSLSAPQELQAVQARAVELLDHSIGRIDGTVGGGYSTYPDYAKIGEAASNIELLVAAKRAPAAGSVTTEPAAAVDAAQGAGMATGDRLVG